jgi:predicted nucleic acid-binding protein
VVIYLDTSAFLKLYVIEDQSQLVDQLVRSQSDPLPVWDLLRAEMINALRLKVFWKELEEGEASRLAATFDDRIRRGQYWVPQIGRSELMADFARLSHHTPEIGTRTMDILHVACALQLEPERFVTFDKRQRSLALLAGLRVVPEA